MHRPCCPLEGKVPERSEGERGVIITKKEEVKPPLFFWWRQLAPLRCALVAVRDLFALFCEKLILISTAPLPQKILRLFWGAPFLPTGLFSLRHTDCIQTVRPQTDCSRSRLPLQVLLYVRLRPSEKGRYNLPFSLGGDNRT